MEIWQLKLKNLKKYNRWADIVKFLEDERAQDDKLFSDETYLSELGFAYTQLEFFEQAISTYKRIVELFPDKARNWYNYGFVYYQKGDFEEAKRLFHKALEFYPDYILPRYRLAVIETVKKNPEKVIQYTTEIMEIYKKIGERKQRMYRKYFVRANFYKAKGFVILGDYKNAIEYFKNTILLDRTNYFEQFTKYYALANAYFHSEDYLNAYETIKKVIDLKPYVEYPYYLYASILMELERYDEALEAINRAILRKKKAYLFRKKAEILINLQKYDDALEILRVNEKKEKKALHKVYFLIGKIFFSKNELDEALLYAQKAQEKKKELYGEEVFYREAEDLETDIMLLKAGDTLNWQNLKEVSKEEILPKNIPEESSFEEDDIGKEINFSEHYEEVEEVEVVKEMDENDYFNGV